MTWGSKRTAQLATRLEFTPRLAKCHRIVRTRGGRWSRVLDTACARGMLAGARRKRRR